MFPILKIDGRQTSTEQLNWSWICLQDIEVVVAIKVKVAYGIKAVGNGCNGIVLIMHKVPRRWVNGHFQDLCRRVVPNGPDQGGNINLVHDARLCLDSSGNGLHGIKPSSIGFELVLPTKGRSHGRDNILTGPRHTGWYGWDICVLGNDQDRCWLDDRVGIAKIVVFHDAVATGIGHVVVVADTSDVIRIAIRHGQNTRRVG
mmetsp:Transcript_18429/g.35012  ORF Transcript_18429/g.35012 Transcript_18429/m.35012 type:complete len:202 (-) Transcript_18429:626-1231(-)